MWLFSTFYRGGMQKVNIFNYIYNCISRISHREGRLFHSHWSSPPQPIAMAGVEFLRPSNVTGTTTALQIQPQMLKHHSNHSLYLTNPNLDPLSNVKPGYSHFINFSTRTPSLGLPKLYHICLAQLCWIPLSPKEPFIPSRLFLCRFPERKLLF